MARLSGSSSGRLMGITTTRRPITKVIGSTWDERSDAIAVESPLTIVLDGEVLVTTMRTPGHDLELAAGWLVNESGVRRSSDIIGMGAFATAAREIDERAEEAPAEEPVIDTVRLRLQDGVAPPRPRANHSPCRSGICPPYSSSARHSSPRSQRCDKPSVSGYTGTMRCRCVDASPSASTISVSGWSIVRGLRESSLPWTKTSSPTRNFSASHGTFHQRQWSRPVPSSRMNSNVDLVFFA